MAKGQGKQPYPVGHTREGHPEQIGWAELVRLSERSNTTVREMRDIYPDFPEPVSVTSATPVYLADEARTFFANHPRLRAHNLTEDTIRSLQAMVDRGTPRDTIARILDIHINTVAKYANLPRI